MGVDDTYKSMPLSASEADDAPGMVIHTGCGWHGANLRVSVWVRVGFQLALPPSLHVLGVVRLSNEIHLTWIVPHLGHFLLKTGCYFSSQRACFLTGPGSWYQLYPISILYVNNCSILNLRLPTCCHHIWSAFSADNRIDDPLQKVSTSSSVVASKNTVTPWPWLCWRAVWKRIRGFPLKKLGKME